MQPGLTSIAISDRLVADPLEFRLPNIACSSDLQTQSPWQCLIQDTNNNKVRHLPLGLENYDSYICTHTHLIKAYRPKHSKQYALWLMNFSYLISSLNQNFKNSVNIMLVCNMVQTSLIKTMKVNTTLVHKTTTIIRSFLAMKVSQHWNHFLQNAIVYWDWMLVYRSYTFPSCKLIIHKYIDCNL